MKNTLIYTAIILSSLLLFSGCDLTKEKAPRIPIEDFFRNPERTDYKLSPCGYYIAWLKPWKNRLNIYVGNYKLRDSVRVSDSEERDIFKYFWVNESRLLYLIDSEGTGNFSAWAVNADGSDRKRIAEKAESIEILDLLENDEKNILILFFGKNSSVPDVYKVNVNNGNLTLVEKNNGSVTDYLADNDGNLRLAIARKGLTSTILFRENENEEFYPVLKSDSFSEVKPLFFSFDNRYIYISTNLGRDKQALIKYDPIKQEEKEVVFKHPEVDVYHLLRSKARKKIVGAAFISWKYEIEFFDDSAKNIFKQISARLPGNEIVNVSVDNKETRMIFRTYSDRSLGAYYFYDVERKKLKKLADVSPWLNSDELAEMKPIRFLARDGETIFGYLTLPEGKKPRNLPVVVVPHGGPSLRDSWGFRSDVQFLANRGYAVLNVNFRGSAGYGKEFQKGGFREWSGTIINDIADGVNWLIEQEIADPEKIAIYGYSFGGYATIESMIQYPDLYCCGAAHSAITNLFSFYKTIPASWEPYREMLYRMIGNPESDSLLIVKQSPVFNLEKIKHPLFIAQGANDHTAPRIDTDRFVIKLKKRGIDVEYMIKENEGHGFNNEENRIEFFETLEKFLARNLDGRLK